MYQEHYDAGSIIQPGDAREDFVGPLTLHIPPKSAHPTQNLLLCSSAMTLLLS